VSRKLFAVIITTLLTASLSAAVTATYAATPVLHFQRFNDIYQQRYGGVGGNPFADTLATHIGTFTINTDGTTVRNLSLNSSHDYNFFFSGPRGNDANASFGFFLGSVVKFANQLWGTSLNQGLRNPIQPSGYAMNGTITVDFYLVSWEGAIYFVEGGSYTHTSGKLPPFSIAFSTGSDYWNASFDPMSVDGGVPGQTLPFLHNGSETFPDEEINYGDPPELVSYSFSIINKQSINLSDAVGSLKAKVAEAQITVSNGVANKNYDVNVTFTNQTNTNPFQLTMKNVTNPPTIPYSLYFNNQSVTPGMPIPWNGLKNGTKTLDILVTGVSTNNANLALAGYYQDTIVVNIVPIN